MTDLTLAAANFINTGKMTREGERREICITSKTYQLWLYSCAQAINNEFNIDDSVSPTSNLLLAAMMAYFCNNRVRGISFLYFRNVLAKIICHLCC